MSDRRSIVGVVVAHGSMAQGLVDAVAHIAGPDPESLVSVSNEGRSPEELGRLLDGLIDGRPALIFTDLQTGSCALVARLVCREKRDRAVIFGVNLAILLDFVFHQDLPLDELVPRLLEKGRKSVRAIPDTLAHADSARQG